MYLYCFIDFTNHVDEEWEPITTSGTKVEDSWETSEESDRD